METEELISGMQRALAAASANAEQIRGESALALEDERAWDSFALAWIQYSSPGVGLLELARQAGDFATDMLNRRRRVLGVDLAENAPSP